MTLVELLTHSPIKPKDIAQYLDISLRDLYRVLEFLGLNRKKIGQYYITRDQALTIINLHNKYGK